jgi:hypothetical protein
MSNPAVSESRNPFDNSKYENFALAEVTDTFMSCVGQVSENLDLATFLFFHKFLLYSEAQGLSDVDIDSRRSTLNKLFEEMEVDENDLPFQKYLDFQQDLAKVYSNYFSEIKDLTIDQKTEFYQEKIRPIINNLDIKNRDSLLFHLDEIFCACCALVDTKIEEQAKISETEDPYLILLSQVLNCVNGALNRLQGLYQKIEEQFDEDDADACVHSIAKLVNIELLAYRASLFLKDTFIDDSDADFDFATSLFTDTSFREIDSIPKIEGRIPHDQFEFRAVLEKIPNSSKLEIVPEGLAWPQGFTSMSETAPNLTYRATFLKQTELALRKFLKDYPSLNIRLENTEDSLILNFDNSILNIEKYQDGPLLNISNCVSDVNFSFKDEQVDDLSSEDHDQEQDLNGSLKHLENLESVILKQKSSDVYNQANLDNQNNVHEDRDKHDYDFDIDQELETLECLSAFVKNQHKQVMLVQLLGTNNQERIDNTVRTAMEYTANLEEPQISLLDKLQNNRILDSKFSPVLITASLPHYFPRRYFLTDTVQIYRNYLIEVLRLNIVDTCQESICESNIILDPEIFGLQDTLKELCSVAVPISIELRDKEQELCKYFLQVNPMIKAEYDKLQIVKDRDFFTESVYQLFFEDLKKQHTDFIDLGLKEIIKKLKEFVGTVPNLAFRVENAIYTKDPTGIQIHLLYSIFSGTDSLCNSLIAISKVDGEVKIESFSLDV